MIVHPLYPHAKPIDADVLILCEGDAIGYETALLKKWSDSIDLDNRFVKVFACGTAGALYGMSDAIGRTTPIVVVEDRDYRTPDEARRECEKNRENRRGRGAAVQEWLAWRRAEIENYLVDDAVLVPVFSGLFDCKDVEVRDAIQSALDLLRISQALQFALYRLRKNWDSSDMRAVRVEAIKWAADGRVAVPKDEVKTKLHGRLGKWQARLHDENGWLEPIAGRKVLDEFEQKCTEWSNLSYDSPIWRTDWGCKEVVQHVRMHLAQLKPGWWSLKDAPDRSVRWSELPEPRRSEHDRFIEREVQKHLVEALANHIKSEPTCDLRQELDQLASVIRAT